MSARRDPDVLPLPPLLARVIEAARFDPGNLAERTGHADLLEELSQWAVLYVPANVYHWSRLWYLPTTSSGRLFDGEDGDAIQRGRSPAGGV